MYFQLVNKYLDYVPDNLTKSFVNEIVKNHHLLVEELRDFYDFIIANLDLNEEKELLEYET